MVLDLEFSGGSAVDASALGQTVTAENSGPTVDRYTTIDDAYLADVNSRLVVSSNALVLSDEFSISMFVRFNEPWTFHAESLAWKFAHPSTDGFQLSVDQNDSAYGADNYQLGFSITSAGVNATKIMSYAEISNWFHVVATFEQGIVNLYVDGQLVASDSGSSTMVDSLHDYTWVVHFIL